jgi:hypothetical protein
MRLIQGGKESMKKKIVLWAGALMMLLAFAITAG